ncbi:MAG: hypothetical protein LQ340_006355 [Diploschistes diacapsis]|nr:MAG: hypothetical protein LQ340_006355 [Diploschistes diacapsis]
MKAARSLAHAFAKHGIRLVYGGGTVGLMGELARTLVSLSGPEAVHGIIPQALVQYEAAGRPIHVGKQGQVQQDVGIGANGEAVASDQAEKCDDATMNAANTLVGGGSITEPVPQFEVFGKTTVVNSMHERKQMMADLVKAGGPGSGFIALSGGYGTLEELMEVTTWNQLGIHARGICLYSVGGYWNGLVQWIQTAVESGFITEKNRAIVVLKEDAEACVEALKGYEVSNGRFQLKWEEK